MKFHKGSHGFHAPHLLAVVVDKDAFWQDNEENAPFFHAGLFTQQLLLSLHASGIASCCLNWHVDKIVDDAAKKTLGLSDNLSIACLVYFGYSKNKKEVKAFKREQDKFCFFIH